MDKKKILIIDDEFAIRYLIERHMSRHGFEMLMARDGQTGLKMAHEQMPDLIVLDVQLPDLNGFDLCQALQDEPELANIPVLIFTSRITSEDKYKAFTVGADGFISKPFLPDEFLAHVNAILQKSSKTYTSYNESVQQGKLTAFYGPKGGVGTTTLAVQLSEAISIHEEEKVALIDLDLPLGGIAPLLSLYTQGNIVRLLMHPAKQLDMLLVNQFAQQHRTNLIVISAPGQFIIDSSQCPEPDKLCQLYSLLIENGYHIIVDAGSRLSSLALATLRKANTVFVVSSGQSVANRMTNAFLNSTQMFRLQPNRVLPVLNEVHGASSQVELCRLPAACIAHTSERSRTRLWLKENGVHKMMSIALKSM